MHTKYDDFLVLMLDRINHIAQLVRTSIRLDYHVP